MFTEKMVLKNIQKKIWDGVARWVMDKKPSTTRRPANLEVYYLLNFWDNDDNNGSSVICVPLAKLSRFIRTYMLFIHSFIHSLSSPLPPSPL